MDIVQPVIDRAVDYASASRQPIARIIWIPPQSAIDSPDGMFVLLYSQSCSGSDAQPGDA